MTVPGATREGRPGSSVKSGPNFYRSAVDLSFFVPSTAPVPCTNALTARTYIQGAVAAGSGRAINCVAPAGCRRWWRWLAVVVAPLQPCRRLCQGIQCCCIVGRWTKPAGFVCERQRPASALPIRGCDGCHAATLSRAGILRPCHKADSK